MQIWVFGVGWSCSYNISEECIYIAFFLSAAPCLEIMIVFKDLVLDLDFHPSTNIVAVSLRTGDLLLYRYADEANAAEATPQKLLQVEAHTKACEALRFVNQGRAIVTGSSDCSILSTDVETGTEIARLDHAHGLPINKIVNLTESTIASGDIKGCIKVWDIRQHSCCSTFNVHKDYISDMTFAPESMNLIATSWDRTLSICDLRSNKVPIQAEVSNDLPLSVVIMKNGRKVICGTFSGTLLLYSWGFFNDCSDRIVAFSPCPALPLLKLDEDRIIAGSKGLISLVVPPDGIIQPIARHPSRHGSGHHLALSHDKKFLGCTSYEETLKIWDLDELLQGCENTTSDGDRD